uniref:Uncharacterized protein n=1 Tax=Opuntia streptacantha TaxID=393608 RepID=A0A7C9DBA2_OPUST
MACRLVYHDHQPPKLSPFLLFASCPTPPSLFYCSQAIRFIIRAARINLITSDRLPFFYFIAAVPFHLLCTSSSPSSFSIHHPARKFLCFRFFNFLLILASYDHHQRVPISSSFVSAELVIIITFSINRFHTFFFLGFFPPAFLPVH